MLLMRATQIWCFKFESNGCSSMAPRFELPKPGSPGASRRPARYGPAWLVLCVILCTVGLSYAGNDSEPRLDLGKPYVKGDNVRLDISISGLISGEVLEALHSGLPVTIVFEWRIWQRRSGWWDQPINSGATFFRVFYDVLQNRHDVFDYRGRLLASSNDSAGIERAVSDGPDLKLISAHELNKDTRYFAEVLARIELLDEEEVKNLEEWLSGPDRQRNGLNLVGMLSQRLSNVLDGIVGPGDKTVINRTEDFSGF
ncbi:MAG: DUF4390 domain-containing protein, partial [Candidatus Latescibacterota bacterium]